MFNELYPRDPKKPFYKKRCSLNPQKPMNWKKASCISEGLGINLLQILAEKVYQIPFLVDEDGEERTIEEGGFINPKLEYITANGDEFNGNLHEDVEKACDRLVNELFRKKINDDRTPTHSIPWESELWTDDQSNR